MQKNFKPVSRQENLVVQELHGEVLIYDLAENKAFCLNETSALVWQMCDGKKNVTEINEILSKKLNSPANEDLVWLALDQLKKEKLIETKEDFQIDFNGLSRREVIKKVGLASVIALPLVASLVAPTPASAQSGAPACNTAVASQVAVGGNCPTNCAGATCGAGQPNRTCMTTTGLNSVCG
ncbi:MAG: PqqD family protein [Acidobacteriota bacterium]|nr:PqqD family protein [Acidobacteriota bacterium]